MKIQTNAPTLLLMFALSIIFCALSDSAAFAQTNPPIEGRSQRPSLAGDAPTAQKIQIERADQLPRHVYRVATTATALIQDEAQFVALAKQLEADLLSDLETYVINDRATLKSYYRALSDLAVHRGDYDVAVGYQDKIRELEDKPGLRLQTGIVERALAEAKRAPADRFAGWERGPRGR